MFKSEVSPSPDLPQRVAFADWVESPEDLAAAIIRSLSTEAIKVVNRKLSFFCITVSAAESDAARDGRK